VKVRLMHADKDFEADRPLAAESAAVVEDLGLDQVLAAMADGDTFVLEVAKAAVLSPLAEADEIVYRQQVLADFLAHPDFARRLYSLAHEAVQSHKKMTFRSSNPPPESLRYYSVQSLELFVGHLARVRQLAEEHAPGLASPALVRLCSTISGELDDVYLKALEDCVNELKLSRGLLMSAQLGRANRGAGYVLHKAPPAGLRDRLSRRRDVRNSFDVPDRDSQALRALADLRARGTNIAANAVAQAVDHIRAFFGCLHIELAFYIGCLNLTTALGTKGEPLCTPLPLVGDGPGLRAEGLYDPGLSLRTAERTVGNDVNADGKTLVVVTGANRGGKSTFLRSVGLAYLMMQCGMLVAATSFAAHPCRRVFTHFKRDEGPSMERGKLDEELSRMSAAVSGISPGCLLLCNEPFASTNEREGSDIGRQVFVPLARAGVKVFLVTHLFDLAESLYEKGPDYALFLRAPRQSSARDFRLVQGAPEPTAYGEDVYTRIFGAPPTAGAGRGPDGSR
jgi:hypothetical protein